MRTVFFAAVLLVGCFAQALAQDERQSLVDRLLNPSELQATSEIYMREYAKEFVRSWKTTLPPIDSATEEQLLAELTKRLSTDDIFLIPQVRQLYLDTYTVEELRAMVEFNESAMGRSIALKSKVFDERMAKLYYPQINDKAQQHWYNSVEALRAAGKKL